MENPLIRLMAGYNKGRRAVFGMGPFLCIELMQQKKLQFDGILKNPEDMAAAALLNFDLGFDSTVLPFDLNVEAEILGAEVRYHEGFDGIPVYPTIAEKFVFSAADVVIPDHVAEKGRLPSICRCIRMIKQAASGRGALGMFLPGPFTLAGQVMDMDQMFVMVLKEPEVTEAIFHRLADFIRVLRDIYVTAGVDFIVIE